MSLRYEAVLIDVEANLIRAKSFPSVGTFLRPRRLLPSLISQERRDAGLDGAIGPCECARTCDSSAVLAALDASSRPHARKETHDAWHVRIFAREAGGEIERRLRSLERRLERAGSRASAMAAAPADQVGETVASVLSSIVERFRGGASSMGDEASKFGSEAAKLGNDACAAFPRRSRIARLSRSPLRSVSDSLSGLPAVADRAVSVKGLTAALWRLR